MVPPLVRPPAPPATLVTGCIGPSRAAYPDRVGFSLPARGRRSAVRSSADGLSAGDPSSLAWRDTSLLLPVTATGTIGCDPILCPPPRYVNSARLIDADRRCNGTAPSLYLRSLPRRRQAARPPHPARRRRPELRAAGEGRAPTPRLQARARLRQARPTKKLEEERERGPYKGLAEFCAHRTRPRRHRAGPSRAHSMASGSQGAACCPSAGATLPWRHRPVMIPPVGTIGFPTVSSFDGYITTELTAV